MSKNKFRNYIKKIIESGALKYLKSQVKSKGKDIKYTALKMQDYLRPESRLKLLKTKKKGLKCDQEC